MDVTDFKNIVQEVFTSAEDSDMSITIKFVTIFDDICHQSISPDHTHVVITFRPLNQPLIVLLYEYYFEAMSADVDDIFDKDIFLDNTRITLSFAFRDLILVESDFNIPPNWGRLRVDRYTTTYRIN